MTEKTIEIKNEKKGYQFGTFQGVFTPSILTILGVIMYLRFGWVLGNVGLWKTLLIVTMSTAITWITALAISEFATNMRMGGGGSYFIISRSLGIEAGGAIGLPLFFAKALGVSFYVAGFAESIVALNPDWSIKIVGLLTLVILTLLAFWSADFALKMQYLVLGLITVSLVSFFMGDTSTLPPVLSTDAGIPQKVPFWLVFAVFFPAVTGIEAGLSMSGDLKNPEKALPWGTLGAVLVSFLIYMAIPVFLSGLRINDAQLIENHLIMRDVARWGKFIIYGLWCASLSSALGALLGAPRTLQALANDGVIFRFVGKGYGKENDPRIATVITFVVAFLGIMLGDLNAIATILTMFFLTSYGLLNLAAGVEGMIANPSWRPKFKVHWMWPMLGAVGCLMCMLMISPGATIEATLVIAAVYYLMQRRRMKAYWGDMKYGILMFLARTSLHSLVEKKPDEKTWRPNILVLSGSPSSRWHLIEMADAISHGKGFVTVAAIINEPDADRKRLMTHESTIYNYLKERAVPAVVKVFPSEDILEGAQKLILSYGFGPLVPNTILLGETREAGKALEHAKLFRSVHRNQKNIILFKESPDRTIDRATAQVDLWWSHIGQNAGLMLALAYLLKTSPEWRGTTLIIKSIVDNEEERQKQLDYFSQFIDKENMDAGIQVYVRGEENPFSLIQRHSNQSDMIFLGLKPPLEGESLETYAQYYESLMEKTQDLPSVIFVLAAEDVDFSRIFKLRD